MVEYVQWFFMALITLAGAALSGFHFARGERRACFFWALVAISFIFMVIEDAGDPRHIVAGYASDLLGWDNRYVEGTFFMAMGLPVVYAFLRYWKTPFYYPQTRLYLIVGAALYGMVATASILRHQADFYRRLGGRLSPLLFDDNVPGFFLMDFMVEESIELMAATIFFCGVLVYWRKTITSPTHGISYQGRWRK